MDKRHVPQHTLPQLNILSLHERTKHDEDVSPSDTSPSSSHHTYQPQTPSLAPQQYAETLQRAPRNQSPYFRSHLKPYAATNSVAAPPMTRTRSLPTVTGVRSYSPSPSHSPVRQASPSRSSTTARITPRRSFEESPPQPVLMPSFMEIETIGEDSELDITPRPLSSDRDMQSQPLFPGPVQSNWHTFPRSNSLSRRRPTSPLHQIYQPPPAFSASAPVIGIGSSASPSVTPSTTPPLLLHSAASKYTEYYPFSAASSMPSTPTSVRSRSPSISSLDTIPDSPEAEEAAIEAFNIAKLKAAADAADAADAAENEGGRRRYSGGSGSLSATWGTTGSNRDKRKRWSVCGAERRGDFEMETIPED